MAKSLLIASLLILGTQCASTPSKHERVLHVYRINQVATTVIFQYQVLKTQRVNHLKRRDGSVVNLGYPYLLVMLRVKNITRQPHGPPTTDLLGMKGSMLGPELRWVDDPTPLADIEPQASKTFRLLFGAPKHDTYILGVEGHDKQGNAVAIWMTIPYSVRTKLREGVWCDF